MAPMGRSSAKDYLPWESEIDLLPQGRRGRMLMWSVSSDLSGLDLLDHVIVMGEGHLRRLLRDYADYYNDYRTHLGSNKDTPLGRSVQHRGRITSMPKLGGLHHAYVRI